MIATPPLVCLAALTCAELIAAHSDHAAISVGSLAAGVFLTLSRAAPWMFGGLAGALIIASARGLRQCVAVLRAGLSGDAGRLAIRAGDPRHEVRTGGNRPTR